MLWDSHWDSAGTLAAAGDFQFTDRVWTTFNYRRSSLCEL